MLIAGCYVAPNQVHSLKLSNPSSNTLWLNGKEVLKLSNEKVDLIVNFDACRDAILQFNVSIANRSDQIILISPTDFFCSYSNRLKENFVFKAKNPESIIRNCDKQIEGLKADNQSEDNQELLFSIFDIAENLSKQTKEEREKSFNQQTERENNYKNTIRSNNETINMISNQRDLISREALRKTSLLPGQTISGILYFLSGDDIKKLSLFLPIAGDTLKIDYRTEK